MELSRQRLIDRCQSKVTSIEEFNYDMLTAPPLSMLLSQYDIDSLYHIATSVKYSGNPKKKYEAIDAIMRSRGFVKLSAGTNRVTYRHLESNAFVVKVAADAIGIGDNPKEFKNQFIFKPFVTKVFEVSPCGTVGVFEQVKPIKSREEFLSVADDIYDVINEWFIGKYIMADIGTEFFMNWGIRHYSTFNEGSVAFGPVLLDFPYVYELDGNKLYCSAVDYNSENGRCGGVIDYDDGFNFLICSKCGLKYRVKELAKNIEEQKIIINKKGRSYKMKIGHYNKNGQVVVDNEVVTKTPVDKVVIENTNNKPVGNIKVSFKKNNVEEPVKEEKKSNPAENRGLVKAPVVDDNEAVAQEYQNIIENNPTPSFNEIISNKEYDTIMSYDSEYDILTLSNGVNEITAKLKSIIPEEELDLMIANSPECIERDELRKEVESYKLSLSEKDSTLKEQKAKIKELTAANNNLELAKEDLEKKVEDLDKEIAELKEQLKAAQEVKPEVKIVNGIPAEINNDYEGTDSRYYGDAFVLEGITDTFNGYSSPQIPGKHVIVFPTNNDDFLCKDDRIIAVASINGYFIDELLEKIEEDKK